MKWSLILYENWPTNTKRFRQLWAPSWGPQLTETAYDWPILTKQTQKDRDFGPKLTETDRYWAILTQTDRNGPKLDNLDPNWPKRTKIGQFGPKRTKMDHNWTIWTQTDQNGPLLGNLDPNWPKWTESIQKSWQNLSGFFFRNCQDFFRKMTL